MATSTDKARTILVRNKRNKQESYVTPETWARMQREDSLKESMELVKQKVAPVPPEAKAVFDGKAPIPAPIEPKA